MARDKNTYAKHQRETLKKQKAEAKHERRQKRKAIGGDAAIGAVPSDGNRP